MKIYTSSAHLSAMKNGAMCQPKYGMCKVNIRRVNWIGNCSKLLKKSENN